VSRRLSSPALRALGLAAVVCSVGACMKSPNLPKVAQDIDAGLAELERDHWAEQCAPREYAAARAHRDFAQIEFEQGDARHAGYHLVESKVQLTEASRRAEVCRPDDADGDSIWDHEDQCPDQAEVVNGYKDDDGCPEVDADNDLVFDDADLCIGELEDRDGWQDDDGCPDPDNDNDGFPDEQDRCPLDAEDINGYQDDDGCPEGNEDRDLDGIPDVRDKCPDEKENANQYLDEDGCPDVKPDNVNVTADRIEIEEKVLFQSGRSRILSKSYNILDSVAQVLRDYPALRIRIEGHTDSQGSERINQRLSQQRAESVFDYLVSKGIQASRMDPVGKGEEFPIDTNRTSDGRSNNRRVEFHITNK
jgi:outer membrane protein OmpA-like peptidoglycan-associated protein